LCGLHGQRRRCRDDERGRGGPDNKGFHCRLPETGRAKLHAPAVIAIEIGPASEKGALAEAETWLRRHEREVLPPDLRETLAQSYRHLVMLAQNAFGCAAWGGTMRPGAISVPLATVPSQGQRGRGPAYFVSFSLRYPAQPSRSRQPCPASPTWLSDRLLLPLSRATCWRGRANVSDHCVARWRLIPLQPSRCVPAERRRRYQPMSSPETNCRCR
jgi:hypothetical protein